MAREEFLKNLRLAARHLESFDESERVNRREAVYVLTLPTADLWLTTKAVDGFDAEEFTDLAPAEREELRANVASFREITEAIPPDEPAPKAKSRRARKHLERIIEIVRKPVLEEWLAAQERMIGEAVEAAKSRHWHVERGEKQVVEGFLGRYTAPRLHIFASPDGGVVLNPVARFAANGKGVVDVAVMPTYDTAAMLMLDGGQWRIARHGLDRGRPFSGERLVAQITRLMHNNE